jgi:hypothetical protein
MDGLSSYPNSLILDALSIWGLFGVHPSFGAEIAERAVDAEPRAETLSSGDAGFLGNAFLTRSRKEREEV